MPITITMPALSPTMTEGRLARWLKNEGDEVIAGDVLAEIETDKATMELEAIDDGILARILVPGETDNVQVNAPIALVLEDGEDAAALEGFTPETVAAPEPAPAEEPAPPPAVPPAASAPTPAPAAPAPAPAAPGPTPAGTRILASPLAKRMAADAGIDLGQLSGSGPRGRIVKADILNAQASGAGVAPAAQTAPAVPTPPAMAMPVSGSYTEMPNNSMRKTIARRLVEAKQSIPHIYLTIDCELDRLLALRKEINERREGSGKVSVNDFVIRANALALKAVPAVNASWTEAAILQYSTVDVSVAVALDGGLITPIVRNADLKGLAAISAEIKELAGRAREGKLMPEEYQGGGFSVSNLGMFGIREFSAIINPPQACIMAVGAGQQRPVVKDGALAVATVMTCTLSCDHRVVDGALGAEYLAAFKGFIEDPLSILL